MSERITLSEIAKHLNVSTVTVSKALRGKKGVSSTLAKAIQDAANELGYETSSRKTRSTSAAKNVGILLPERLTSITSSFDWMLYQQVVNRLIELKYFGILEVVKQEAEQALQLPKVFNEHHVDAVILLGQMTDAYVNKIKEYGIPMLLVDFYTGDAELDSIATGGFTAMYQLTEYLHLCGHTKIGFVGKLRASSSIDDRFFGYMKSMIQHGNLMEECMKYHVSDRTVKGYSWQMKLPDEMPTAFVCNCDWVAYNLIRRLKECNYRVPEDVSVVGFDNYNVMEMNDPALTTVEIDINDMAHLVVDILIKKLEGKPYKHGLNIIQGKIIYKDSVNKLI